jgi:hypothetical protein
LTAPKIISRHHPAVSPCQQFISPQLFMSENRSIH